jgi:hypothetical protein
VHFQCCGGWLSGPARRPGLRSCWGRAGPAFSVGAPVAGRTRAGPGPARSRLTLRARGIWGFRRWTWGGCGASRPWDAGLRPHCSHPAGSLTVCRVCLHRDCRRAARAPLDRAGGRDDASTPSGAARWEPHGAAPLCCAGAPAPFAPSSVLARTWSRLSASSPAGAASVIEFSRFVALVLASSLPTCCTGEPWEQRPPPESVWMHVRAPHGRVAFGLGRMRAACPAGPTVVTPTTSTAAPLQGRRRLLLRGEEAAAAAAAGGGGCCCWGRSLRAVAAVGGSSLECFRLPSAVVAAVRLASGPAAAGRGPSLSARKLVALRGQSAGLYIHIHSVPFSGPGPARQPSPC